MSDNIKVAIRVRQLIEKELQQGQRSHWIVKDQSICCEENDNGRKPTPYLFDRVFDEQTVTLDVFEDICKPIVDSALQGIHGTIFAYGQSSSGKTFTMSGTRMQPGVITLAIQEIFSNITNIEHKEFLIRVGYMEIYNEQVTDLLSAEENILKIREDSDHNIMISGLTEEMVNKVEQVIAVIKRGDAKRHTAETKQNDRSSRSHCILRFVIESRTVGNEDEPVNLSHLHFVDLAGSEKAAENTGNRFKEGCAINKSLFTLGNVIRKLSGDDNMTHVSFRDSKLTRLLQNALGGNSNTAIICTITPAAIEESDSTLKFASQAKIIKNKPEVNEVMTDAAMLKKYRREINKLQSKMKENPIIPKDQSIKKSTLSEVLPTELQLSNTDIHMERVELEKKLKEKEEVEQRQADLILKLQEMVVISGTPVKEPPKKKRRETWCPGKATRGLTEKNFLPPIDEISPPQAVKASESRILSRTVPTAPANEVEMDVSFQLLDNIPAFQETLPGPVEETINNNPYIKELFELQDKHEILLEELRKKDAELEEMREFTELERECEKEAINEITKKLKEYESNVPWLEEELMKAQQGRNKLRVELETRNQQLTAVEDGSGLTQKNRQLSDSESKVTALSSDLDVQKSRYEFHLAQMKSKLEIYTKLLEEKGVDPDVIKQRTGDAAHLQDGDDLLTKYEQEVNDLRNEVDSYVQKLEKEEARNSELLQHFEVEFEQQKAVYQNDLQDVKDEREVFRQMFEEERAKFNEVKSTESESDIQALKEKHEQEISKIQSELNNYMELLETERARSSEGLEDEKGDIEALKQKHADEISDLKKDQDKYLELIQAERDDFRSEFESLKQRYDEELQSARAKSDKLKQAESEKDVTETIETMEHNSSIEAETMKQKYEAEIDDLKAEINKYAELLYAEKEKSVVNQTEDCENELKLVIEEMKQTHELELKYLKAELDKYSKFLNIEKEKSNSVKNEVIENDTTSEIEILKQNNEKEINELKAELEKYVLNEKDKPYPEDLGTDVHLEMETLKQQHNDEIRALKAELDQYAELLNAEKENTDINTTENSNLNHEMLKADYEQKLKDLEEDLEMYKDLLLEEQRKNETRNDDVSIDTYNHNQDSVHMQEGMDLQAELMRAEKQTKELDNSVHVHEGMDLQAELMKAEKQTEELDNSVHVRKGMDLQAELMRAEKHTEERNDSTHVHAGMDLQAELMRAEKQTEELDDSVHVHEGMDLQTELMRAEKQTEEINDSAHMHAGMYLQAELTTAEKQTEELNDSAHVHAGMDLQAELMRAEKQTEELTESVHMNTGIDLQTELLRADKQTKEPNTGQESDLRLEILNSEMEELRERYDSEINTLKAQLQKTIELLDIEKQKSNKDQTDTENSDGAAMDDEPSKQNNEDTSQSVDSLAGELEKHIQLLEEQREKCKDLEKEKNEDKLTFDQQRLVYENTIKEIEEELHTVGTTTKKLSTEIKRLETDNRSLKDEKLKLVNEKSDVENEIDNLQEVNQSLEVRAEELLAEVDKLSKLNENLEEKSVDLTIKVDSLNEINCVLEEKCKELSVEAERLNGMSMEQSLEIENLNAKSQELSAETERLSGKSDELIAEIERLENINLQLQTERDSAGSVTAEDSTRVVELESLVSNSEKRIQELTSEIEELQKVNSSLNEEKLTAVNLSDESRAEIDRLKEVTITLTEESERLTADVEKLGNDNEKLKEENETVLILKEEAERKVEVYDETLQELKADLKLLEEENSTIKQNLKLKSIETSNSSSEIDFLKAHVKELEDDAKVNSELVVEYDSEVKELKSKLVALECSKSEELDSSKLKLQQKLDDYINEREDLLKRVKDLEAINLNRCTIESLNSDLEEKCNALEEEKDTLIQKLKVLEEDSVNKDVFNKMQTEYEEKITSYKLKHESLETLLSELEESSVNKDSFEKLKVNLEEKICDLVSEKEELQDMLQKLREEASGRDVSERMKTELMEKLDTLEAEKSELGVKFSQLEEEKTSMKKTVERLEEEKSSLEDDLFQAENNLPKDSLKINTVESNEDWEKKWSHFVREEKKKRVGLILELRGLHKELKEEKSHRENAFQEAMMTAQEEVRKQDMYQEMQNRFKKSENEANLLHSDLEDEKEKVKQLQAQAEKENKTTEELKQKIEELNKQLLEKEKDSKSIKGDGFVETSHSCNYKLEAFSLQRQMKESQEDYKQRVLEYEETVQSQESRINKLKNEIRRLQSMDESINFKKPAQLDFSDSTPSSCKKAKVETPTCGSSSSGGIIDHFKVVVTESENKRLKKEIQKQASKLARFDQLEKEKLMLEKENISLKGELKTSVVKSKTIDEHNQSSEPRHPLTDVITKASDHWDSSSRSSTSTHPKPKFEFPDLEPKQSDGRLIVDGKDMQEEVNNCKSQ